MLAKPFVLGIALVTVPMVAHAQEGTEPEAEVEASASEQSDDLADEDIPEDAKDGEVIVITGSAIERKALTTPAPVSIIDRADLEASGLSSVGDVLQDLPAQSNAINVQFNNGGDGATRVSLRGLGAARTLVLVNGRRHVPGGTGANASVDLNSIPFAVIERVEVLKDGASAIYGSDAIGGVVNIITKKDFDGTEANVYTGSTQSGGGFVYDVSVATGHTTKKGSIVFAAGYHEQGEIRAGERSFSTTDKAYDWETGEVSTRGSSATPAGYINDRSGDAGNSQWDAVVTRAGDAGTTFYNDPNGGWRPFNFDGTSDIGAGDLYNYQPENYLLTPSSRYNMYSAGRYEFHDNVEGFFEASYTNRQSDQLLAPTPLFTISEGITVSADSVYNEFGRDFVDVRRRFVEAGNRQFNQDLNTFRIVSGFQGDVPDQVLEDWRYNVHYNYGRTQGLSLNQGRFVRSRVEQAIGPSYRDDDNVARCGTVDNPGDANCVPLDLFGGAGSVTPEMLAYISYDGTASGFTEQKSLGASVSGKLFETPWGGVGSVAFGASYRDESGGFTPDPITASGDTTGNKQEATGGGYDVREGYTELSFIPVVNKPLAKWVELSAAVRAFDYSTFGSDVTWKAGGLWGIAGGFAVRGTYSTAFRAPSVGELFAGAADAFPGVTDPCDTSQGDRSETVNANCTADGLPADYVDDRTQLRSLVGGNPLLEPETANVLTLGAVYEPDFVDGLSFTVDYFAIELDNAIQPAGASVILSNCYAQQNREDCDLITRDANGFITVIEDLESNIGGSETAGIDFQIRYDIQTNGFGAFSTNLEGTWLQKYDESLAGRTITGKGFYDLGVFPDLKFNGSVLWGYQRYGAGINGRFINGFTECEDNDCSGENLSRDVDSNFTADAFATVNMPSTVGTSSLTLGVNNILDQDPSIIFNGFLATSDASTYDFMGRFFYARFSQSF